MSEKNLIIYSDGSQMTTNLPDVSLAYHIYLNHNDDFKITLTEDSFLSEAKTDGKHTEAIILYPSTDKLFTSSSNYVIEDIKVADKNDYINFTLKQSPDRFAVSSVYPNPFNPSMNFDIDLVQEANLNVSIYDINGRLVNEITNTINNPPGKYQFTWNGDHVASGVYLLTVKMNDQINTQLITLIK